MPTNWNDCMISTFADFADVEAFRRCKAEGKTDQECFRVGDNGIGCYGDDTTRTDTCYVALHGDDLVARWGSIKAAKHRKVEIEHDGITITAIVGDRCGVPNRADINPGSQRSLRIRAGSLVPGRWRWVE